MCFAPRLFHFLNKYSTAQQFVDAIGFNLWWKSNEGIHTYHLYRNIYEKKRRHGNEIKKVKKQHDFVFVSTIRFLKPVTPHPKACARLTRVITACAPLTLMVARSAPATSTSRRMRKTSVSVSTLKYLPWNAFFRLRQNDTW